MTTEKESKKTKRMKSMLRVYAVLHKQLKRDPSASEMATAGVSRDAIKHHFSQLKKLAAASRLEYPSMFFDEELSVDTLDAKEAELNACINSYSKFVITTAVVGCPVDAAFYASIKNYCRQQDACLLVLVASDPAKTATPGGMGSIDRALLQENIVLRDVRLNDNLFISTIKLSAKHIDPITGLDRIGQRNGSFVFASPKQRLKLVATSNTGMPCALMTPGAVTKPSYGTSRYMSERTAYLADNDHVIGGIIVEIEDSKAFHFRQIQADSKGRFVDLGEQYTGYSTKRASAKALILGDWHSGSTDDTVKRLIPAMCATLKPSTIVLHDAFDGRSISHHTQHNSVLRAQQATLGHDNLKSELSGLAEDLKFLSDLADGVVVVKSNHDEHLGRYVKEGRYVNDPHNLHTALCVALEMVEGKDPLVAGLNIVRGDIMQKLKGKITFLERDDDYVVEGFQLGCHGDRGSNGSRGSLQAMEKAYGKSISGHSHTPQILRGAIAVGTCSVLQLDYNSGPSSWLQTMAVLYQGGGFQLVSVIRGKWRL